MYESRAPIKQCPLNKDKYKNYNKKQSVLTFWSLLKSDLSNGDEATDLLGEVL
jgi:hypothetical protein